jgi:putative transposase
MARLARIVAAGVAHLVVQRGNRGQNVFFGDGDYALYKELLAEGCKAAGTAIWAYCLMPNQVQLLLVPSDEDGLRAALGDAHRRYTRAINLREGWRGFLWQGRFASFPMDEAHVLEAARTVERAPVRDKLARSVRDWKWSSARAHLAGKSDGVVDVKPLRALVHDWAAFLRSPPPEGALEAIRKSESTGRPLGSAGFIKKLEKRLGRTLAKQKPGPKPKGAKERKKKG